MKKKVRGKRTIIRYREIVNPNPNIIVGGFLQGDSSKKQEEGIESTSIGKHRNG